MSHSDKEMITIISYGILQYLIQSATWYVKSYRGKLLLVGSMSHFDEELIKIILRHFKIFDT
jgi:hypothetical protein